MEELSSGRVENIHVEIVRILVSLRIPNVPNLRKSGVISAAVCGG